MYQSFTYLFIFILITKRYFSRITGEEVTEIRQSWHEGGSTGSGQWQVIVGYRAAESEKGDDQVRRGNRVEMTRDHYYETDMGDAQVGG